MKGKLTHLDVMTYNRKPLTRMDGQANGQTGFLYPTMHSVCAQ